MEIHKSSFGLCSRAPCPNKGSGAQKQKPHELLWTLWFDKKKVYLVWHIFRSKKCRSTLLPDRMLLLCNTSLTLDISYHLSLVVMSSRTEGVENTTKKCKKFVKSLFHKENPKYYYISHTYFYCNIFFCILRALYNAMLREDRSHDWVVKLSWTNTLKKKMYITIISIY